MLYITKEMKNSNIGRAVLYLIVSVIFTGCFKSGLDRRVEDALEISGGNRAELEKVLRHYADDPEKLAAAKYLIANMPGHFSFSDTAAVGNFYDALDTLLTAMEGAPRNALRDSVNELCAQMDIDCFGKVYDINVVQADYLIANIDEAFREWKELPWNRSLTFGQFCEYLLPYKTTELQALDSWRSEYGGMFADSVESLMSCSLYRLSAYRMAEAINNGLMKKYNMTDTESGIPQLFYRPATRLKFPFGTCDELSRPAISFFRSAGVPVAVDYVHVWGYGNRGHTWAVVLAPNGKEIPFVPLSTSPYEQHKVNETVGKAYRATYDADDVLVALNTSGEWVPPTFRNIFQKDVTAKYAVTRDIEVPADGSYGDYAYLCSPSRAAWKPVAVGRISGGKARFEDVGTGCVFLVCQYDRNGGQHPVSEPVRVNRDGSVESVTPDFENRTNVTLYRKSPLLDYAWKKAVETEGAVFEASDTPDFRNPAWRCAVTTKADRAGEIVLPEDAGRHRYWRFVKRNVTDSARCYIGEIAFYSGDSIINGKGTPIGTFDSRSNDIFEKAERAFDGDVLTAFSVTRCKEAWVGLDFNGPVGVTKIQYTPRSDGNMIEPGDEYELMYWHGGKWNSAGSKTATTVSIDFNDVPSGALYVLLNKTKGSSVRVFFIDADGNQEWW